MLLLLLLLLRTRGVVRGSARRAEALELVSYLLFALRVELLGLRLLLLWALLLVVVSNPGRSTIVCGVTRLTEFLELVAHPFLILLVINLHGLLVVVVVAVVELLLLLGPMPGSPVPSLTPRILRF